MHPVNFKNLGNRQKEIIGSMIRDENVISEVWNHSDNSCQVMLTDKEGENYFDSITPKILSSLVGRNIFDLKTDTPSLQVTIHTYSISPDTADILKANVFFGR